MKEIKHDNSSHHHRPIQRQKIPLSGNQIPVPALRKLNRPINTPHINTQDRETHRSKERHQSPSGQPPIQTIQKPLRERATHEIRRARHEDGYREELEHDARDHCVGARVRVAADFAGFRRCQAAADGLHDQRDHVAGAENPEVEAGGEDGGFAAEEVDEAAEEDVDAGCEEGGSWIWWLALLLVLCSHSVRSSSTSTLVCGFTNDQGRDLHQECICIIRTLRGPSATSPANNFRYSR